MEYFSASCSEDHALMQYDEDVLLLKFMVLLCAIHKTFVGMKWFQGYGEGATECYDKLCDIRDYYNVRTIRLSMFPRALQSYIDSQLEYSKMDIENILQLLYVHFYETHKRHFNDSHQWMLFYENMRNFDPSFKNKASTIQLATQHLKFGYHAYSAPRYAATLRKMVEEWQLYLRDTRNTNDKPQSIGRWWKEHKERYTSIHGMGYRGSRQPRGGSDVERSFIHFTNLMRLPEAASMAPIIKETRVMAQCNADDLVEKVFGMNQ